MKPLFVLGVSLLALAPCAHAQTQPPSEFPGMGLIPSSPAAIARSPQFTVRTTARGELPARVLLTDYLPPVANQGKQNSCTGWATAYYAYTYAVSQRRRLTPTRLQEPRLQFSPAYLYNQINNGKDKGSPLSEAFRVLREQGCATWDTMPYVEQNYSAAPSPAARERAREFQAEAVGCLFAMSTRRDPALVQKLKIFLAEAHQPIVTAIPILPDFPRQAVAPGTVYHAAPPTLPPDRVGFHSITLVGYDEAKHAFRMVNSWGKGWGEEGFLWLDEEFIARYATEGWAMAPGGLRARGGSVKVSPRITLTLPLR
jgi:Papain family cysteine protease